MAYHEEENEEYDDYQDEEEIQQQINQIQEQQMKIEEKILKNKLRLCLARISKGSLTLNMDEKNTIKKAKKHPNLKNEINLITAMLLVNKGKVAAKAISTGPALWYVLLGALILVVIICVVAAVGSIMPYLFPDDEGTGESGSVFGVSGKDFYGVRTVYKDDEKATVSIIEDYVQLVEDGISEAKSITTVTASAGGETFSGELIINIEMPNEEFNYSTFEETTFSSEYSVLYTTIFDIAKVVYKVDNSTDFAGSSLVECVNGILYFGYDQTIMADVSEIITNTIIANSSFNSSDDTENKINKANDVDPLITSKLETLYGQDKYKVRAEKLFVKDYIFEEDDDKMENVPKANYVAFIFMPKNNVTFTKFSFSAGGADLSEFTISLKNNGNEIALTKDDSDFSTDESVNAFIYTSRDNLNVGASVFADIDTTNLSALSAGLSLFDVVENVENYSTYLESVTSENSVQYLTIRKNGVVANLSNKEAFNFVEFETIWE